VTAGDEPRLPHSVYQEVQAVSGFAYGVIGADIHVFGDGTPVYLLHEHRTHTRRDSAWLRAQPSRMLGARAEVVEFTGRDAELAALRAWRDSGAPMAVRWLHGAGGQGKTRLVEQLAAESLAAGWLVVDAVHGTETHPPAEGSQDLRVAGQRGVLLLVDYADRWPASHLSWLFQNGVLRQSVPVRVLLAARSVDAWPALRAKLNRLGASVDTSDQALSPLSHEHGDRAVMFEAARTGFARHYPGLARPAEIAPPATLEDPDFGLTLAVHMAALVAVDALAHGRRVPADMVGLTTYLLDREHENWRQLHENREVGLSYGTPSSVMARAVFTAVLTGSLPRSRGDALLSRLMLDAPVDQLVTDHAVCYPATELTSANVLHPLLPDRLAEDFLALSLPGSPITGYPTDLWTVTAVQIVLDRSTGPTPPYAPRAVSFLAAAAERWRHVGERVLFPLLRRDPQLAVEAGSAVLTSLAAIDELDPEVLHAIGAFLPLYPSVQLGLGAGDFGERVAQDVLSSTSDVSAQAASQATLSVWRDNADRSEEALEAAREAVALYRDLADADPNHRSALAEAAVSVGGLLDGLGRAAESLPVCEEAVHLYRELTDADSKYMSGLAAALHTYSMALFHVGRLDRALDVAQEADDVYGQLLDTDLPAYFFAMAGHAYLCHDRAIMLEQAGREDEAVTLMESAVVTIRQLAANNPDARTPALAAALLSLAKHLQHGGRLDDAAALAEESVCLYRTLAKVRPSYLRTLAKAAHTLGMLLIDAGRPGDAVPYLEEAVGHYRVLVQTHRDDQHADFLAHALHVLREHQRPPRVAWGSAGEIDDAAARLARAGDWPGLWALTCAVPIADALRVVRRLPLRRWQPPDDAGRALAIRLADENRKAAADAAEAAIHAGTLRTADVFVNADRISFAPGRPFLTLNTNELDGGQRVDRVDLLDLASGSRTQMYRGPEIHYALACLGPDDVVAVRDHQMGGELVHYSGGTTYPLGDGKLFDGARIAATVDGYVVGLRLAHGALVGRPWEPPRVVDLHPFGLRRGDCVAVDPTGTRLAFADGPRFTVSDAQLTATLAEAMISPDHGDVVDLVFTAPDELVTTGTGGRMFLWQLIAGSALLVARAEAIPRLRQLFAVPAWRVIGGWAHSESKPYFFDSVTLAPVGVPRNVIGGGGYLQAIAASADGRYLAYGGQLSVDAPRRHRSFELTTVVHDLRHPSALILRPLASLGTVDLAAPTPPSQAIPPGVRSLLDLVRAVGAYRLGVDDRVPS
jgi:tetratricopeptide (TPR) repeat protein